MAYGLVLIEHRCIFLPLQVMSLPKWSVQLPHSWSFAILSSNHNLMKTHSIRLTTPSLASIRNMRSSRKPVCMTISHYHVNILSPTITSSSNNLELWMVSVHQLQSLNTLKSSKIPIITPVTMNCLGICCWQISGWTSWKPPVSILPHGGCQRDHHYHLCCLMNIMQMLPPMWLIILVTVEMLKLMVESYPWGT